MTKGQARILSTALLICIAFGKIQPAAAMSACSRVPTLIPGKYHSISSEVSYSTSIFRQNGKRNLFNLVKVAKWQGAKIAPIAPRVPRAVAVPSLLGESNLKALINGSFFDVGTLQPKGDIVIDSKISLKSFDRSRQFSITNSGKPIASRIVSHVSLSFLGKVVQGGTVNSQVSSDKFSFFDGRFASVAGPAGSATLVAAISGKVLKFYSPGVLIQPTLNTFVIQVPTAQIKEFEGVEAGTEINVIHTVTTEDGAPITSSIGVGARILKSGLLVEKCNKYNQSITPRSAVGWNSKGTVFLATTSSGALESVKMNRSGGSTTTQLASWLRKLGASDAVLLDGGGSVCLYVKTRNGWQRLDEPRATDSRSIPNAIGVFGTN